MAHLHRATSNAADLTSDHIRPADFAQDELVQEVAPVASTQSADNDRLLLGEVAVLATERHYYDSGRPTHLVDDQYENCYSMVFRAGIESGLIDSDEAARRLEQIRLGNPDSFRSEVYPQGFTEIPWSRDEDGRIHIDREEAIPAGQMISIEGGTHVVVATGQRDEQGDHLVYSFKGGTVDNPTVGYNSVGVDPQARIHLTTLEHEMQLIADTATEGDIGLPDDTRVVAGSIIP